MECVRGLEPVLALLAHQGISSGEEMRLGKPQGERRRGEKTIIPLAEREAFSEALETKSGQFSLKVVLVQHTFPFPRHPLRNENQKC